MDPDTRILSWNAGCLLNKSIELAAFMTFMRHCASERNTSCPLRQDSLYTTQFPAPTDKMLEEAAELQ